MVDAHILGKQITTKDIDRLIVGGQTGVDGIQFCIANSVNGEDLTDPSFGWFLQFKNKYGMGEPIALFPIYEESLIKLPWVPGLTATQIAGRLQIQVFAAKTEGVGEDVLLVKQWVSAPAVVYIEENLDPTAIVPVEPSLFNQYLVLFTSLKDEAATSESNAAHSAEDALESENAAKESEENAGESEENAAISEAKAQKWAENPVDTEVEEGKFSAKHYAIKADEYRQGAEDLYEDLDAVRAAKEAAEIAEDNARKWAENPEDVEVEEEQYSSLHHAKKAAASASAASTSEFNAGVSESEASSYAETAFGYKEEVISNKADAESFRDEALASRDEAVLARDAAVGAAAAANGWMLINGQKYVVSREAVNGHIVKTISLYVEEE